jgi:glucose/arabinose dehydrogenase
MKKPILIIISVVVLAGLGWIGIFYYQNLRGVGPALFPPKGDITQTVTSTKPTTSKPINNGSLKMPDGFAVSVFAKNLPGARVLAIDSLGNMWVSQTSQGKITLLEMKDGKVANQNAVFRNLQSPHGLAFDPEEPFTLYFAEETKISKVALYSEDTPHKIADLPKKGGHFTRTLGFGPDGRLYVSIGSTCNVCHEDDPRYASIWSMKKDGSDFKEVAGGLRNSVFIVFNKNDGKMWATEMGRDSLGDDIPPDEINIIDTNAKDILNFGWPNCYGKNIHDTSFDKNTYIRNPCMEPFEKESHIDVPAHSAPLGLAFVSDKAGWPGDYKNDLLVAYHGSWNRSVPTGYKVVRYHLDNSGNVLSVTDFLSGWVKGKAADGRPVDIIFDQKGKMYISDDKAGVVYQVEYIK